MDIKCYPYYLKEACIYSRFILWIIFCDNVIDPHFTQNVFNQKHQFCFCLRFLLSIYRFFVFFVFIGLKSDFSFNVLYKHEIEFIKNGYNTSL